MKIKHFILSLILSMPAIPCFAAQSGSYYAYDLYIQNATGCTLTQVSQTTGRETLITYPWGYDIAPNTGSYRRYATLSTINGNPNPSGTITLSEGSCVITLSGKNLKQNEAHSTSSKYTCEIAPYGIDSMQTLIIIKKN